MTESRRFSAAAVLRGVFRTVREIPLVLLALTLVLALGRWGLSEAATVLRSAMPEAIAILMVQVVAGLWTSLLAAAVAHQSLGLARGARRPLLGPGLLDVVAVLPLLAVLFGMLELPALAMMAVIKLDSSEGAELSGHLLLVVIVGGLYRLALIWALGIAPSLALDGGRGAFGAIAASVRLARPHLLGMVLVVLVTAVALVLLYGVVGLITDAIGDQAGIWLSRILSAAIATAAALVLPAAYLELRRLQDPEDLQGAAATFD